MPGNMCNRCNRQILTESKKNSDNNKKNARMTRIYTRVRKTGNIGNIGNKSGWQNLKTKKMTDQDPRKCKHYYPGLKACKYQEKLASAYRDEIRIIVCQGDKCEYFTSKNEENDNRKKR